MYMTDHEAAEHLGLSVHTMRDWRRLNKGPKYHKLGRSVRYLATDLDEWATSPKTTNGEKK